MVKIYTIYLMVLFSKCIHAWDEEERFFPNLINMYVPHFLFNYIAKHVCGRLNV